MQNQDYVIELIEKIFDDGKSLSTCMSSEDIFRLAFSDADDVRYWVAKALVYESEEIMATELLMHLSKDSNEYVRVEAVDSLSSFCNAESYSALRSALFDNNELVRAYAAVGIAYVGQTVSSEDAIDVLHNVIQQERSMLVLVRIYEGLYLLGDRTAVEKMIHLYESDDYHVRCTTLRALADIVNKENLSQIQIFICGIDIFGQPIAVREAAYELIDQCETLIK